MLDLARSRRDRRADGLGTRDHAPVARKVGRSRDQRVQGNPLRTDVMNKSGGDGQFLVDLFDRLALGLNPEEIIHRSGHQEPAPEINESRWNLRQGYIRLEVVARAHDQGQAYRPDDLADAAEAIGPATARGPQVRRPDLRRIGP